MQSTMQQVSIALLALGFTAVSLTVDTQPEVIPGKHNLQSGEVLTSSDLIGPVNQSSSIFQIMEALDDCTYYLSELDNFDDTVCREVIRVANNQPYLISHNGSSEPVALEEKIRASATQLCRREWLATADRESWDLTSCLTRTGALALK